MLKSLALENFFGTAAPRGPAVIHRMSAARPAVWQKWATVGLAGACLMLLGSYLVSVNSYAASGYEIKKLQTQISSLAEANQKLNVKVSQVSSIVAVESAVLGANFVPAGTPQFLQTQQLSAR